MKAIQNYLLRHRRLVLFLLILFVMGTFTGVFLGISNLETVRPFLVSFIQSSSKRIPNYLWMHFSLLSLGVIFSCIGIGIPFFFVLFFYEALGFGFFVSSFTMVAFLKGFFFSFLFCILTKGFYVIILCFIISKCIRLPGMILELKKGGSDAFLDLKKIFMSSSILLSLMLLYDLFLTFLGESIFSFLSFLLVSL